MATMSNSYEFETYRVIHPLNDEPEEKCTIESASPMEITPSVRRSLYLLRGYLLLMSGMLMYRVAELAGVFHRLN
jgi:hypothetical protein